jgi:hypothetical protein
MNYRRTIPVKPHPMEACCLYCRWWVSKCEVDETLVGECRRLAPVNINNPLGSGYALTIDCDFCAQFKPTAGVHPDRFIFPILNTRTPDL